MTNIRIIGDNLPHMPWEDKPEGYTGTVWRHSANPITGWNPTPSTARIYNSAVVPYGDSFIGVFRADQKNGKAQMHLGRSRDALHWEFEDEPISWVDEDGKPFQPIHGYDPRLVQVEGTYYIIWCTEYGGPTLGLGMTKDFRTFVRLENIFPPFNRNGVLFPRKIGGKFVLLHRPSDNGHTPFGDIFLSESPDMRHWGRHRRVMTRGGGGWWQVTKIGAGPIPIETTAGWLMLYHGVNQTCSGFVYSMGGAILDLDNPAKVLYRTRDYLLTPEQPYESTGFVPNVVFPCATLQDAATGRIAIYYGAADTCTGVAYAYADELVTHIMSHSELAPGDGAVDR